MKKVINLCLLFSLLYLNIANGQTIFNNTRSRHIPVDIMFPAEVGTCSEQQPCPVAFVSAGYGVSHMQYSFIAKLMSDKGFMVVAVGHELKSDPPLSVSGDLYQTRAENWQRGADTLKFLKASLSNKYKAYDFENLTLVGHSNGGDISAWLANESAGFVTRVITLDHRRVPLPRRQNIQVLSIRAGDFPADSGVLPSEPEAKKYNICIINIAEAKHNDIADYGPAWLKQKITNIVGSYVEGNTCNKLALI